MKKALSFFLALSVLSLFSAEDVKLRIAVTTAPVAALTKAVTAGSPGITVEQVVPVAAGCPHDYAMTPADVRKISAADVVVFNGLGMDDVFRNAAGKKHLDSSKGVKGILVPEEHEEHHGHGHHHHHHESGANEHLFASPSTAAEVVFSIANQLAARYPRYAEQFKANGEKYASELRKIAKEYAEFGKSIPANKRSVCASHSIFAYLCRDLGLKMEFLISIHDAHEPSAADRLKLIRGMKKAGTSFIAVEAQGSRKAADMISRETKVPVIAFQIQPDKPDPELFLKNFRDHLNLLRNHYGRK